MGFIDDFKNNGVAVVKNFATIEECDEMKRRMNELVNGWNGKCDCVFTAKGSNDSVQGRNDYFFHSSDKIHFFLEEEAIDPTTGNIYPNLDKLTSLNKVGHGLHLIDPVFSKYTNSEKVKKLIKSLGYKDPVLPQSMYILKNPKIGGVVEPHQDATYLYTTPRQTVLGLWLALDEADLENGCLWARKGSHKENLKEQWVRGRNGMEFREVDGQYDLKKKGEFEPLVCAKGDLVLIHGLVDHMSYANRSGRQRHTFQLHLIEGPKAGVEWHRGNWLQYENGKKFISLL
eukprot:maker-scaffold_6-snap-gene-20.56-mRNA-1 protein AED:0.01 eAED:0.01 QI:152/1/1/1/1/1/2/69/286